MLLVLPKVCSVKQVKEELCSVLGGALAPDSIIVAVVKENHVDHVLVSQRLARDTNVLRSSFWLSG